jgi:hypothetical protein
MTVWIYINTAKEVGDVDHLKVFATEEAPRTSGSCSANQRSARLSMRSWRGHWTPKRDSVTAD